MKAPGLSFGHFLASCGSGAPCVDRSPLRLAPDITHAGEAIYFGSVYPLADDTQPRTYVYERRVAEHGDSVVSTHITRDPAGRIVLAESATHAPDYTLTEYTLHGNQLGQSGSIRVEGDAVVFHRIDGARERRKVERGAHGGAIVVGPTLVGFITRHLSALRAGERIPVRLAILERLETLGFELRGERTASGETRVRMKPTNVLIAMMVDPIDTTFDAESEKLVRLRGRVPPKVRDGKRLRDFDARVEYEYVAAEYR